MPALFYSIKCLSATWVRNDFLWEDFHSKGVPWKGWLEGGASKGLQACKFIVWSKKWIRLCILGINTIFWNLGRKWLGGKWRGENNQFQGENGGGKTAGRKRRGENGWGENGCKGIQIIAYLGFVFLKNQSKKNLVMVCYIVECTYFMV